MSDSASSPEHPSNSEVGYQTTSSHFRPNMQSPPYQGSVVSGINYSDRPYENQMGPHYQSNSYASYQPPPSPYRPHPVSPPSHHYNSSVSQMHSYPAAHQMAPYSTSQSPYGGSITQDLFPNRGSLYSGTGSGHNMQSLKSSWNDASNGEMLQPYGQSARSSLLNSPSPMPPPLRSPPHSSLSVTPGTPLPHSHYRQMPMSSSPNQSPHSWPQSQIPSPGVMHSPRATPSPLPNHRSPGHAPFSPPPPAPSTTPSPHHPPPTATPHPQIPKTAPSSPTLSSPASQVAVSADPLQSLQKMVMLDSEARTNYEMQTSHAPVPSGGRPATYFSSVENLAGNDPGSPYPTYYNLDQNRLCTPPRTTGSTPTSSSFISAPDSTSNSSVSGDSYVAPETGISQTNGDLPQNCSPNQPDCVPRCISDCTVPNGEGPGHQMMRNELLPLYDLSCYSTNGSKKNVKAVRARRKSTPADFGVNEVEPDMPDRMFLSPPLRKCISGLPQDESIMNGQLDCFRDESTVRKRARGTRAYNAAARWSRGVSGEGLVGSEDTNCMVDNGVFLSLTSKRGPRKRRSVSCPTGTDLIAEFSDDLSVDSCASKSPRSGRGRSPRSGRRSRRRAGSAIPYVGDRMADNPFVEMHPIDGIGEMTNLGKRDDEAWDGPSLHVGTSPSTDECVFREHESSSMMTAPMMESSGNPVMLNQPMSPRRTIVDYSRSAGAVGLEPPMNSAQPLLERKRGRPRGSKNKPKLPGEEIKPKKAKKKKVPELLPTATTSLSEQYPQHQPQQQQQQQHLVQFQKVKKGRTLTGPYVHIIGTKENPLAIEVVNTVAPKEEEKDLKFVKQKRQQHLGASLRKKLGVGHSSTLSPFYDAVTRDRSWVCALCCKGSHYKGLGDLFGPYYTKEDQKPSTSVATSSSGVPTPMSITTDDGEHGSPSTVRRVVRTKRRCSDTVEEFLKINHLKKGKQGKKSNISEPANLANPESSFSPAATTSTAHLMTLPVGEGENINHEFWVHEDCAVWSHGVFLVRHHIRGLEEAVREAANMVCSRCKLSGAMVGCLNRGCTEQYHVICAREKGCEMDEDNFSLFCPKHKRKSKADEEC